MNWSGVTMQSEGRREFNVNIFFAYLQPPTNYRRLKTSPRISMSDFTIEVPYSEMTLPIEYARSSLFIGVQYKCSPCLDCSGVATGHEGDRLFLTTGGAQ
jgi:hypothetical protein